PSLGRFVVRSLVDPSNRLARPWRTVEEIVEWKEVRGHGSAEQVGELLGRLADDFHVVQRPEVWDRQPEEHFQLVHDELIQRALTACTPQEIGLGIVRPALKRGRRFLWPRELRAVERSDLSVLPKPQYQAARRLVQRTRGLLVGAGSGAALLL